MNPAENAKTYTSKQLTNIHFHLSLQLKEDLSEDQSNSFKDDLGTYLENNGGILYHIRPIKNKTLQLYVVARKEEFNQTDFSNWVAEQLKELAEGNPSILILSNP